MEPIAHVVIVGGGTAGWLTAGLLAADHCAKDQDGLKVTLVESANVPTVGVGEGTWPTLRDTLQRIGIAEGDFLRRCGAAFKQGSRFDGWVNGQDSYLHPFDAPPSEDSCDPATLQRAAGEASFAEAISAQAALMRQGLAPKQPQTPPFAAVANYGYHLDSAAFAALLRDHCVQKLGVTHRIAHVEDVILGDAGYVEALVTRQKAQIAGDLFVDCTGSRARLIGDAMGEPVTDVSHMLFNDRALALRVPYARDEDPIASQTNATAQEAGWVWDIGLQTRRGIGYVFSSRHSDEDQAKSVLHRYLTDHASHAVNDVERARLLKFRSAYRAQPWSGNVVAIGQSQGFVEPLEASAIVMIELAATALSDLLPPMRSQLRSSADRFNRRFSYRWERIVEFLKAHYILSQRPEPYWADHRDPQSWPERLRDNMERWKSVPPSREDFEQAREIFTAASYAFVLYGMGLQTAPSPHRRRRASQQRADSHLAQTLKRREQWTAHLPAHRDLLNHICGVPMAEPVS
jgi:2-polyprenyl-6-methoxyphenol hydroxylase-like FAD-dependent oxidoreductase